MFDFFQRNADYLLFLRSVGLLALAYQVWQMERDGMKGWRWLAAYLAGQALMPWFQILEIGGCSWPGSAS